MVFNSGRWVLSGLLSALVLAGCGGGGGGGGSGSSAESEAIQASKILLEALKSDWQALFGSDTTTGAFKTESTEFSTAMDTVKLPAEVLVKDSGVLLIGVDLYNDYKAGRTTTPSRGRGDEEDYETTGTPGPTPPSALGCTLYQDAGLATTATAPGNANFIGCSARYFMNFTTNTQFYHGFTVTPGTSAGNFTYSSRARSRVGAGASTQLQTTPTSLGTGTLVVTADIAGHVTDYHVAGTLPGAFDGTAIVYDHHSWDVSGSRSTPAGVATTSLAGTLSARSAADGILGTLTVGAGSQATQGTVGAGGADITSFTLKDASWLAGTALIEGTLALSDVQPNKANVYVPTRASFTGALSNMHGTAKDTFLSGTMTVAASNVANWDDSVATSSSNFITLDLAFNGTATAPSRPQLVVAFTATKKTSDQDPSAATLQYKSISGGTTRTVDVTLQMDGTVAVITVVDAAAGLSLTTRDDAASADLMLNGTTRIGTLNTDTGVLTFTDGTFISVDIGR